MNFYIRSISLVHLFCFLLNFLGAQNKTDERLANQYYDAKQFDKAVIYYEKLHDKTSAYDHYLRLLNCYLELEEFKNGEKLIKRKTKKDSYSLGYAVDLGYLYERSEQLSKSKQSYEKAIKMLTSSSEQVLKLASNFLKYKKTELAVQTYLRGRKLLGATYPLNFELAKVYSLQGKTALMIQEYLDLLLYQESYLQSVQNALQTALSDDEKNEKKGYLKSLLIKNIQREPNRKVFSEMLIWVYIQEKNFNGAFIQAKAMVRRHKERGDRIVALAKLSMENKDYETSIKCYKYLIDRGPSSNYYVDSRMKLVNVYNEKIVSSGDYTKDDLRSLEKEYITAIDELGKKASTYSILQGYAHLQAFYLNNADSAIILLKEIIKIPRLTPTNIAKSKVELADVYLFTGEIWEASLLYSQVEKAYKYDRLGEIAKFKNAKIYFYTGDFGWAKSQLDVLKASTSKLIANDAMKLSVLITDNIGIDTTKAPLLMFANADLLSFQNKDDEAIVVLDSLESLFPYHEIIGDILFKKYEISYKQKNYQIAANHLEQIKDDYSDDILADDAIYCLAMLYDNKLNDQGRALELYKKIMFEYQSSIYVVNARKRFRELRKNDPTIDGKGSDDSSIDGEQKENGRFLFGN